MTALEYMKSYNKAELKKTIKATKACIKHWYENFDMLNLNYFSKQLLVEDIKIGGQHCALCKRFTIKQKRNCNLCPVKPSCPQENSVWFKIYCWNYEQGESEYASGYEKISRMIIMLIEILDKLEKKLCKLN